MPCSARWPSWAPGSGTHDGELLRETFDTRRRPAQ
jgi:hypothetical protein